MTVNDARRAGELLTRFRADLRDLRLRAGMPTYRELQRRTSYGRTVLSQAFNDGGPPPTWPVLGAIVAALDGDLVKWRRRWAAVARGAAHGAEPAEPDALGHPIPRQLPAAAAHFVGRRDELDALRTWCGRDSARLVLVTGPAGIGKTTFAVHWAHQVADAFPDGQIHVDLRGYDRDVDPRPPGEVLHHILISLGVPSAAIPPEVEARAALFRTTVSGRRLLLVLDNARDAEQVRPLLPGCSTCLVLVTSRQQLITLVAREHARIVPLPLFSDEEAHELLTRFLGRTRTGDVAARSIVEHCANLPLAVSIVAAKARLRPAVPLTDVLRELSDERGRLAGLSTGDSDTTDLRTVFTWSYRSLPEDAAQLFCLLGLHPNTGAAATTLSSMADVADLHVGERLAHLERLHLAERDAHRRVAIHDLLHAYAAEVAADRLDAAEVRQATERMLDHYLHTGLTAVRLIDNTRHLAVGSASPGVRPEPLPDIAAAWAWFAHETDSLFAASTLAAGAGFTEHAWQLLWLMGTYLDRQGRWQDLVTTQLAVLAAARSRNDRPGQAFAHRGLGRAFMRLDAPDQALHHYEQADTLYNSLADHEGRAHTQLDIGWVFDKTGHHEAAMERADRAATLFAEANNPRGRASALSSIGWELTVLDRHDEALPVCAEAAAIHHELGNHRNEGDCWDSMGHAHHHLGDVVESRECYQRALDLLRRSGDRYEIAATLSRLGDVENDLGDPAAARENWKQAMTLMTDLAHPDQDELRAKLQRSPAKLAAHLRQVDPTEPV
jgi:tetratricopeptide (TPR) repeat protein